MDTSSSSWRVAMLAALAAGMPAAIAFPSPAAAMQSYNVSLVAIELRPGERIFGFEIEIAGSAMQSLRWNHGNWSVSSVNVNGTGEIKGMTGDRKAAVQPAAFGDFLTIGVMQGGVMQGDMMNGKPRLQGNLLLRDASDAPRRMSLMPAQFLLRPLP